MICVCVFVCVFVCVCVPYQGKRWTISTDYLRPCRTWRDSDTPNNGLLMQFNRFFINNNGNMHQWGAAYHPPLIFNTSSCYNGENELLSESLLLFVGKISITQGKWYLHLTFIVQKDNCVCVKCIINNLIELIWIIFTILQAFNFFKKHQKKEKCYGEAYFHVTTELSV